jgi:hypothetical protein
MFECSYTRRLFWEAIREMTGVKQPRLHPTTWAKDLLLGNLWSPDESALLASCCWSLWTGRNNRNHGRSNWSPGAATKLVTEMVQDVLQLQVKKEPKELVVSRWKPHNVDLVKVNTDGAFDGKKCQGGTGVVIRDARGCLISAHSKWYAHMEDVLMSEALANRGGLISANTAGLINVEVESDSLSVIKLMNNLHRLIDRRWQVCGMKFRNLEMVLASVVFDTLQGKLMELLTAVLNLHLRSILIVIGGGLAPDFLYAALVKDV